MERTVCDEPVQCLLPQHVKRALVYMRSNVAEKITLPRLAATCAVPERTLMKQFKRFVWLSPLAYLRRLRRHKLRLHSSWTVRHRVSTRLRRVAVSDQAARAQ